MPKRVQHQIHEIKWWWSISTYHIYARTIFERQKLKLKIYLFVSTFFLFSYFVRGAWNLVCLGVWADLSKCLLLTDAVSTVCRPNMSTKPKRFSAVIASPRYQALRCAWVRARFYRFLIFTMGGSRGGDRDPDPPPPCKITSYIGFYREWAIWTPLQIVGPPDNFGSPLEPRKMIIFYESNRWSSVK